MRNVRSERAAGVVVVVAALVSGCLDSNPWFVEPTTSDSGVMTTTGLPTTDTEAPTSTSTTAMATSTTTTATTTTGTTGVDTEGPVLTEGTMTSATTIATDGTTGVQPICGNGVVESGEECDEGVNNAEKGMCTPVCLIAVCGDGFKLAGSEQCDNGVPDSTSGCVACQVPHSCKEILDLDPLASTGPAKIDPDGPEMMELMPVYCDMDIDGGGWTLMERSPRGDPIGLALYKDYPQNQDDPLNPRHRLPRDVMSTIAFLSSEMWLECGGADHLNAAAQSLFAGQDGPEGCGNIDKVLYKEAELKGYKRTNVELCTVFHGVNDGECPGAFSIDEDNQYDCLLENYMWNGMNEGVTTPSTDAFAVDPQTVDMTPPVHDCHFPGAMRQIFVR